LQWTLADDQAFFASRRFRNPSRPLVPFLLDAAHRRGMRVRVGLAYAPRFWTLAGKEPLEMSAALRPARIASEAAALELAPVTGRHPAFDGWYLSEEIDDKTWSTPECRRALVEHLKKVSATLRSLTPAASLAVSSFTNAFLSPRLYGEFVAGILAEAGIDTLYFQDGVGAGKLSVSEAPEYFAEVQRALAARSRRLKIVVELFEQKPAGSGFDTRPAPWARVAEQIRVASPYSSGGLAAFSVSDYMLESPLLAAYRRAAGLDRPGANAKPSGR
jgi:hypothetical protein